MGQRGPADRVALQADARPAAHYLLRTLQATDKSAVEKAIENAKETCEQGNVGACAAAWDEVRLLRLWPTPAHLCCDVAKLPARAGGRAGRQRLGQEAHGAPPPEQACLETAQTPC